MKLKKMIRKSGLYTIITAGLVLIGCHQDKGPIYQDRCNDGIQNGDETGIDCGGSECDPCPEEEMFIGTFIQEDQMGRPLVNLLFNEESLRDSLNLTIPSEMKARFSEVFKNRLMALDTTFTTNTLGLDAGAMADLFSGDVLWVAHEGSTAYFNGSEVMTGRKPGEDVANHMLLWIFGGPDGTKHSENPRLINDGVPANDAEFLNEFPYLAPPFEE